MTGLSNFSGLSGSTGLWNGATGLWSGASGFQDSGGGGPTPPGPPDPPAGYGYVIDHTGAYVRDPNGAWVIVSLWLLNQGLWADGRTWQDTATWQD